MKNPPHSLLLLLPLLSTATPLQLLLPSKKSGEDFWSCESLRDARLWKFGNPHECCCPNSPPRGALRAAAVLEGQKGTKGVSAGDTVTLMERAQPAAPPAPLAFCREFQSSEGKSAGWGCLGGPQGETEPKFPGDCFCQGWRLREFSSPLQSPSCFPGREFLGLGERGSGW